MMMGFLFTCSVILFLFAIIWVTICVRQRTWNRHIVFVALLIFMASLWFARFSAGLFMMRGLWGEEYAGLTLFETVLDSLVHTLQTFSMDEDYTFYLLLTRGMIQGLTGSEALAEWAGGFCAVQSALAPVVGGAVILDILSNIFPRLKLYMVMGRDMYVFSELNERAICLAEDLSRQEKPISLWGERPGKGKIAIVFTDAYVDKESERESELLYRARTVGAVCLRDEVTTLKLPARKRVIYVLLDEDRLANLSTAARLSEKYSQLCARAEGMELIFAAQDEYASETVKDMFTPKAGDSRGGRREIIVKVFREDTNLVYDLFKDQPLFKPALHGPEGVSLLVLSTPEISLEVAKAAYWCGQLLDPETGEWMRPEIHLLGGEELRDRLRQDMPGVDLEQDRLCRWSFHPWTCFSDLRALFDEGHELDRCSYVVVALGNDGKNLEAARWLRQRYDRLRLMDGRTTMICYQVRDATLNRCVQTGDRPDFQPFGALEDQYSVQSIFAPELERLACQIDLCYSEDIEAALAMKGDAGSNQSKEDRVTFLRDEYIRRSSIATVIHAPYKLFSVAPKLVERRDVSREEIEAQVERRRDELAWLEHLRWQAYMLSCGYTCPSEEKMRAYFMGDPNATAPKCEALKYHPCIVDSRPGRLIRWEDWDHAYLEEYDALDNVSLRFNQMLREKFPEQWKDARDLWRQMDVIYAHLDEDGVLHDPAGCRAALAKDTAELFLPEAAYPDGSAKKWDAEERKKALEGLRDKGDKRFDEVKLKLLFPMDYKQNDYKMLWSVQIVCERHQAASRMPAPGAGRKTAVL